MSGGVIAVIGHVDHGKTSLVHALTGIVTDRLKEEHERGLSISLGFAHAHTPAGVLNFIDAPGHHNFLRTTVSGLSGAASLPQQPTLDIRFSQYPDNHDSQQKMPFLHLVTMEDIASRADNESAHVDESGAVQEDALL